MGCDNIRKIWIKKVTGGFMLVMAYFNIQNNSHKCRPRWVHSPAPSARTDISTKLYIPYNTIFDFPYPSDTFHHKSKVYLFITPPFFHWINTDIPWMLSQPSHQHVLLLCCYPSSRNWKIEGGAQNGIINY